MSKFRLTVVVFIMALAMLALVLPVSAAGTEEKISTVEFYHRWSGQHMEVLTEIIAQFEKENPEIKVDNVSTPGLYENLQQKILARYAAGEEPPDIAALGYNMLLHGVRVFKPASIDELAKNEKESIYKTFIPAALDLGKVEGVQYGLPYALSNQVVFYNPQIFKEAGLDENSFPTDWDELQSVAKRIKSVTGKFALYIPANTWFMQALIESNGGRMLGGDGKAKFNSPEAAEAIRMWTQLYSDELIPKVTPKEGFNSFLGEQIGISLGSVTFLGGWKNSLPSLKVGQFPIFGDKKRRQPGGGAVLSILAQKPARRKTAWKLVKFMVSREGFERFVQTGYISPLAEKIPAIDPRQDPAYEQLVNMVPWTNWPGPNGLEAHSKINNQLTVILHGPPEEVQESLNKLVRQVNALLE